MKIYQVISPKSSYDDYTESILITTTSLDDANRVLDDYNHHITEGFKENLPLPIEDFLVYDEKYKDYRFIYHYEHKDGSAFNEEEYDLYDKLCNIFLTYFSSTEKCHMGKIMTYEVEDYKKIDFENII